MLDLAKAFTHSRDLGFVTDLRGGILEITAGAERAMGYARSELVGRELPALEEAGELKRVFEATPVRSRLNLGFHLKTKSGSVLAVNALLSSLRNEAGAPIGWFIAGQDLTGAVTEARAGQSLLDALVDSIGAAVWSFDRNGRVITWSLACQAAFGWSRVEAEGSLSVESLFASPEEYRRVLAEVDPSGRYSGEIDLVPRDGLRRPHQVTVTPLVAVGQPVGYTCVSLDLTPRKRAEEIQRVLFEQAGEGILVADFATRAVVDANARACEMHGYGRDELLRLAVEDLLPLEARPAMAGIGKSLHETGRYDGQQIHRRKDGSVFPCALNLRTVAVGDRKLVICLYRDLTEQLKAEEYFRVLFQRASDAVYLVEEPELRIVEANEAACRMFGYMREELLQLRVPDLVPPEFRNRIAAVRQSVTENSGYRRDRRMYLRKDGSTVATDNAISRVQISGAAYFICSCRDLTDQERAARELEEAKAFLEHVQENASDGFALLDENGVFVSVNRRFLEWNGLQREDMIGTPWMKRTTPEQMAGFQDVWDRQMRGERISMRTTMERPNGPTVIVDVNSGMIQRGGKKYIFAIVRDVTEQVKREEELRRSREDLERHVAERTGELRESEARFRGITEATPLPVTITRPDGEILYYNEATSRLFFIDSAEGIGRNVADFYADPADRPIVRERILREGKVEDCELKFRRRDGTLIWSVVHLRVMTFQGGPAILGTFLDITARKQAEAALRESEERFRGAFANTGIGMCLVGPDGRFLQVNPSLCSLLGYGQEELLATTFQALTHPEDREKSVDLARRMWAGELRIAQMEKRYLRKQGGVLWAYVSITLVRDPDGRPKYFVTGVQDITELRESEERFRAITQGVPVAVVIARASDGTILFANEQATETLGFEPGAVEGRKVPEFLALPEQRDLLQSRLRRDGHVLGQEIQFKRIDGTLFWGVASLRLTSFKGEPVTLGVFSDITARKEAEALLRKAHEELERRVDERTAELARANALLQEEIFERERAENALRLVIEGTAAATGGSFFRSLVRHLASALDVRHVIVVQRPERPDGPARMIAFWMGNDFASPVDYALEGTPGADVIGGMACSYAHDVQRLFPEDRMLAALGAESYQGVPMPDSAGKIVGLLSVVDDKPATDEERKLSILKIFASRAGVELERQLAEEALRASEERWRSLVVNAPDFIITVDRSSKVLSLNRTVAGLPVESVIGKLVLDFVPPDSREKVQTALERVFAEGTPQSYETRAIGPNGSLAWYSSRVGPIILGGDVVGATFIATDITERRKIEQGQTVQHEVTQLLAEAVSLEEAVPLILRRLCEGLDWQVGLLWKVDPGLGSLHFGEAWTAPLPSLRPFAEACRHAAHPAGTEAAGRSLKERGPQWIPDVQADPAFDRSAAAARAGLHACISLPVAGASGLFGVIELFNTAVRSPEEPLLRMAAALGSQIGQFVERKRAEEDLRFQKSLLESQSEAAIDGILVVSREGVMTSFNRRFCQMWEIPEEVIRSRTDERALQSVLDKLSSPKEFLDRVRYLYDHPNEESRDEVTLKDGRVFDRYSAPVKGHEGALYGRVWYFRDVTGRKQTEENLRRAAQETRKAYEELKEAQAQLIRSEKLASIGMLVSGVAHEINNPLNVMYGNLQLLAEVSDVLLPLSLEGARAKKVRGTAGRVSKFRGMIRDALKAARHAREIVQDFRNFARDTRTAELVDLNRCLEEAVTLIQRELKPGIRVVRKLGRIPQVRCLRGQMSQVFLNLLKNAGEAIEKKGTVTLRTRQKNGQVLVEVADTGRGMPEEVRSKLFEPFFTTKPVGKGLGLGLSISAMIVQNHNGRITVRSQVGRGSVFQVELPLTS